MKYEDIQAVNWSTLKLLLISPAYMRHVATHPEESTDSDSKRQGRVTHCALLEPDELFGRYMVKPKFAGKGAKSAEAEWREALPFDVEIISQAELDTALRCADAIRKNQHCREILRSAKFEQVVQWVDEDTGISCKGRLDIVNLGVIDLKTSRHIELHGLMRDAANYDYHGQCAFYHDGAIATGIIPGHYLPKAIFVSSPKGTKYVDVAVLDMGYEPDTLDHGRKLCRRLLALYQGCQIEGRWPGMAQDKRGWTLPQYKWED